MAELCRELVKILPASGCRLVRRGKGSHEVWRSSTKSRHTANEVLKRAGLPKAF